MLFYQRAQSCSQSTITIGERDDGELVILEDGIERKVQSNLFTKIIIEKIVRFKNIFFKIMEGMLQS